MTLEGFANDLEAINKAFQILAGIRRLVSIREGEVDAALVAAQKQAEHAFQQLAQQWNEARLAPVPVLTDLILK